MDRNNWACGAQGQGCPGPLGATPAAQGGPGGLLNGARGRRGGGEDFCTAPRTRRGTPPPWSQIEDVVSWPLTEVTEGGSGAPTTRLDRGNHQLPPDRPHGAGGILSTGDIFGLTCRVPGVPGVLPGHGGDYPRYAPCVEVPGNISIMSFYTHIRRFYKQRSPRSCSEQVMLIGRFTSVWSPKSSDVSLAVSLRACGH